MMDLSIHIHRLIRANMPIASQHVWVKNFSIQRAGYQMMVPIEGEGIRNGQCALFGARHPLFLARYFIVYRGVDVEGAYFRASDLQRLAKAIVKAIDQYPDRIEKLHRRTYELNNALMAFDKKFIRTNLALLTDGELGKLYHDHIRHQQSAHQHALTTTWFVDSHGEILSKKLMETVDRLVRPVGRENETAQIFSMLTTKPALSFATREERSSLKVLARILGSAQARRAFHKDMTLEAFKRLPKSVQSAIERHVHQWCWTPFGYMGPAYDIEYYLQVWSGLVRQRVDANGELRKIRERLSTVRQQRLTLMKELKMDGPTRTIMDIAADIAFLKGYRKDCLYFGFYALERILKEMTERFTVSLRQLYLMTPSEVEALCQSGKISSAKEIHGREGFCIHVVRHGRLKILTGGRARTFLALQTLEAEAPVDARELKGICACVGSATGVVKVINVAEDMANMRKGDIMVSHTTFPSLLPAMRIAAAIITEDGGITCHAAIVSRELGIPCVTGIKSATSALKDGDRVEVDADNGLVRKI